MTSLLTVSIPFPSSHVPLLAGQPPGVPDRATRFIARIVPLAGRIAVLPSGSTRSAARAHAGPGGTQQQGFRARSWMLLRSTALSLNLTHCVKLRKANCTNSRTIRRFQMGTYLRWVRLHTCQDGKQTLPPSSRERSACSGGDSLRLPGGAC
jgi:hypothetical protein